MRHMHVIRSDALLIVSRVKALLTPKGTQRNSDVSHETTIRAAAEKSLRQNGIHEIDLVLLLHCDLASFQAK